MSAGECGESGAPSLLQLLRDLGELSRDLRQSSLKRALEPIGRTAAWERDEAPETFPTGM